MRTPPVQVWPSLLLDLRSKLSEAADFAQSHSDAAQQSYAAHYNLRSRQKSFQEGDQVIVLAPENSGKLCNRWCGPGTIVKVKSPFSYLVDLGNGNVRHMHANKMRHFVARVQGCGVIAESDIDFGEGHRKVTEKRHPLSCLMKVLRRVSAFLQKRSRI